MVKTIQEYTLIIGGDSNIGSALLTSLEAEGNKVLSTTCFYENVNDRCFFLDLSADMNSWVMPSRSIKTAIICAAITSHEQCQLNPEQSWQVNVGGTVALATRLVKAGVFVIFLSSNAVFNGEKPFAKDTNPVTPKTEYGRHKAEAENQLLKLGNKVAVVRFSKVITSVMPLIKNWISDLKAGKVIHPFIDMVIAPVPISFAVSVLCSIAIKHLPGIIQVSAKQDVLYADLARYIAFKLGCNEDLVQPISFLDAGISYASENTTLESSRLLELGLQPPDVWTSVDETFMLNKK
jgi:dTDP-4-dehydrorhamnose reductase